MKDNISTAYEIARYNAMKKSKTVTTNQNINLDKLSKDRSDYNKKAEEIFKRKPFYFNYDEKGMFKK